MSRSVVECREPPGSFGLFLDAERIIEFLEESRERDAQDELYDLRFNEMAAQPDEKPVLDPVSITSIRGRGRSCAGTSMRRIK
jgi:hypothetical protein